MKELINKIHNADCLQFMKQLPDKSIDLVLTSPPYDNLRTYNDTLVWNENIWQEIIKEIFRITKDGGVCVWIVGDATINGSETGTSFKQALWAKECGFNLHDTMIYLKDQLAFPDFNRYYNAFEYMFVFSKGKPKTTNLIKDRENKSAGRDVNGCERNTDGTLKRQRSQAGKIIEKFGIRWNYWLMYNLKRGIETQHPAIFPLKLAQDHIISWSNEDDLVLDCFSGSGTTAIACSELKRNFICIEKDKGYYEASCKRLENYNKQLKLF